MRTCTWYLVSELNISLMVGRNVAATSREGINIFVFEKVAVSGER